MNFLLIPETHRDELISTLETCYEIWKKRDAEECERDLANGIIHCYSTFHLIYELPLAMLKNAECVSIKNGFISPPQDDQEQFYLVAGNYKIDTPRIIRGYGFDSTASYLEDAPEIWLPIAFTFIDADNDLFEIIAWDEEDARHRLENDNRVKMPVEFFSSHSAFPFSGAIWKGRFEEPTLDEVNIVDTSEGNDAENIDESFPRFGPDNEEIPF